MIDDHVVTRDEPHRTPEKVSDYGRIRAFASGQAPRRERPQQNSVVQLACRRPVSAMVQSSAAYRGYRSGLTFGLQNLGNTCYLNAVMQALCSLREFVSDLRVMPKSIPHVAEGRIFAGSLDILQQMGNAASAQGPLSPAKLRELIAEASPMFGGNQQQDAHEFLLEYVNQLHDELLGARKAWLDAHSIVDSDEALPPTQLHLDSEIQKTLRCVNCSQCREVSERFRDFSLDFPAQSPIVHVGSEERCELRSMLGNYFKAELLEAKCEHCLAPAAEMSKQLTLPPQVLVLHLKRFVPNVEKQRYEKQHQTVDIPLSFNLKSYLREAYATSSGKREHSSPGRLPARPLASEVAPQSTASSSAAWEVHLNDEWKAFSPDEAQFLEEAYAKSPNGSCERQARGSNYEFRFSAMSQVNKDSTTCRPIRRRMVSSAPSSDGVAEEVASGPVYNLRSIVAHDGASPHSGHYVTYARSETGSWKLYDDSLVREVADGQELLRTLGRKAYILFYVKQSQ
jgi:ubiquitin C-terminal hydrolase